MVPILRKLTVTQVAEFPCFILVELGSFMDLGSDRLRFYVDPTFESNFDKLSFPKVENPGIFRFKGGGAYVKLDGFILDPPKWGYKWI